MIKHKFYNISPKQNPFNWDDHFYTENTILKNIDLYKPEIMFLGTFNPDLKNNHADFFYGRNYFWPAFKNLFNEGKVVLNEPRLTTKPFVPKLQEIFKLCIRLKLTFADLVESVSDKHENYKSVVIQNKEYILFGDMKYNLISDMCLQKLNGLNKVNWNTENIITYLKNNTQIKKIYLTRGLSLCWKTQVKQITQALPEIEIIPIYTPSAQGGALHRQTGIYNNGKMVPLLRHWTKNNTGNYDSLNHNNWLMNNGVDINNF